MIRVDIPNDLSLSDPGWKAWRTKALKATDDLIADAQAGKDLSFDPALYKGPRAKLLELFHYKCAYCETRVDANQHYGDVEHYRPKGSVTDSEGKLVFIEDNGERRRHPGYYWLAYEWTNVLPSCAGCNRPGTLPTGETGGKHDKFPVASLHAWNPAQIPQERPLLLNPRIHDPDQHLRFDPLGLLVPLSDEGAETIRILLLNRDALVERRRQAYESAHVAFFDYLNEARRRIPDLEPFERTLRAATSGTAEYTGAMRAGVRAAEAKHAQALLRLRNVALPPPAPPPPPQGAASS